MFMFAIAGVAFGKMLPEDKKLKILGINNQTMRNWIEGNSAWISQDVFDRLTAHFGFAPGCVAWPHGEPKPAEVAAREQEPDIRLLTERFYRANSEGMETARAKQAALAVSEKGMS